MKLYALPGATSLATHIALEMAGEAAEPGVAGFEVVMLARGQNDEPPFRRINPLGTVPALETDEGIVLTESLATLLHVADKVPQSRLAPPPNSPHRDRLHMLLSIMVTSVHAAFQLYRRSERFAGCEAPAQAAVQTLAAQRIDKYLSLLQDELGTGECLIDAHVSVADLMLFVTARWGMSLPRPTMQYPRLWAFTQRMAAMPAVKRAMQVEGIGMTVPRNGLG